MRGVGSLLLSALWVVAASAGCSSKDNTENESAADGEGGEAGDEATQASAGESGPSTESATSHGEGESEGPGDGDGDAQCPDDLPGAIALAPIRAHLEAFAGFAAAHGDTRTSGTPGYDASAQYVFDQLQAAGYEVSFQEFDFEGFVENSPTIFEQVAPTATSYVAGQDFAVIAGSGNADVTAPVTAVDLDLGLGNGSTSACQSSDFAGFPAGHIALVQRGACTFNQKVANAQAAGAAGVVMFNQGESDDAGRQDFISITVDANGGSTIPGVFISYDDGEAFAGAVDAGLTLRIVVDAETDLTTRNVIAESPGGDASSLLMLGAHLDSVPAGPGLNDNASGSAALLEVALQSARCTPTKKLRFAWWGAEEWGLLGAEHYVSQLDATQRDAIFGYLNFDMLSSPNFVRFVHDGDGDAFDAGPAGSGALEQVFVDWFASQSLPTAPTPLANNSDYAPFADAGIAVGGLATGAGGSKSDAHADLFGGNAGEPYDACYHRACDALANVNDEILLQNAKAIANAVVVLALP